ncbi:DUF1963 domain-containing protein [Dapis sp. BLCC M172]|uniref:DUF1963 domain-containing protein n=1 Tax=Dapis sp. BLCC M172 TaxID=2975281 RepID=UPI003CF5556F
MTNIPPEIQSYKRQAWKPITTDGDGALTASKFAGKPWLAKDEQWPKCRICQNPLDLFVQLNLNQLPEALQNEFGSGILQMFYCTNIDTLCDVDYEGWEAFSDVHFLRIIQPEGEAQDVEIPKTQDFFPPKLIVDWQQLEDYPNSEEASEFGIELNDELYEDNFPIEGDKLAGWPLWIQGIEYPNCPICGETMRLVFQVDSEDNLPFMFGDAGCGYITQCKHHKNQVAFHWNFL